MSGLLRDNSQVKKIIKGRFKKGYCFRRSDDDVLVFIIDDLEITMDFQMEGGVYTGFDYIRTNSENWSHSFDCWEEVKGEKLKELKRCKDLLISELPDSLCSKVEKILSRRNLMDSILEVLVSPVAFIRDLFSRMPINKVLNKLKKLLRVLGDHKKVLALLGVSAVAIMSYRDTIKATLKVLFSQLEDGWLKTAVANVFRVIEKGVDIVAGVIEVVKMVVVNIIFFVESAASKGIEKVVQFLGFKQVEDSVILNH